MSTIYVTQNGAVVRKTGERLRVTYNETLLLDVPFIHVEQLVLLANASVTSSALRSLLEHHVDVAYCSSHGRFIGRIQPEFSKNSILRKSQYRAAMDAQETLTLARGFVWGKMANMRTLLLRAARFDRDSSHHLPEEVSSRVDQIRQLLQRLRAVTSLESLRGYEGAATAIYFAAFPVLLKAEDFTFPGRVRRPPTDPINALLSFGYTLLYNDCQAACNVVGFDPYAGYLHSDKYGKPSLALDLMEEFRPVLVDSLVLSLINKRMLTLRDFEVQMGQVYRLTEAGRKTFLNAYEEKKRQEIKHPVVGTHCTYWRALELQARILSKVLMKELKSYTPFLTK